MLFRCTCIFTLCFALCANGKLAAQCKSYRLSTNNDTINCTDTSNLKQGIWVNTVAALRGEPAYTEQGSYHDGLKEGTWYRFNDMEDVMAVENYRFGYKNGNSTYYNLFGILRQESWKAIDPKNPYDTIKVYDLEDASKYRWQVVRVDATTVKHGTWLYYDPQRNTIIRSEEYVLDELVSNPKKTQLVGINDKNGNGTDSLTAAQNKPQEVLDFERLKGRKKKIILRDGATGIN